MFLVLHLLSILPPGYMTYPMKVLIAGFRLASLVTALSLVSKLKEKKKKTSGNCRLKKDIDNMMMQFD